MSGNYDNFVFGRFKNPFFLWLIQILKALAVIMVTAIVFLVIYAQPGHSPMPMWLVVVW
jgi:hypothetical protein